MIRFIKGKTTGIPTDFLCKHFGVSPSGYYDWKQSSKKIQFVRKQDICSAIKKSFYSSGKTYGSPRIYKDLQEWGISVSENTVAKYMQELGLDARYKKRFRVKTTDSKHNNPIAPRLFEAEGLDPLPKAPGKLLAGDITYLRLGSRFIYLAVVLDLFNREVIGWSIGETLETSLVLNAMDAAMRKVGPDAEIIFHSDRGSQYASEAYRKLLKKYHVIPSMSRRGNCYDNCYVESWFATFKKERLYRRKYATKQELSSIIFEYIEIWYNRQRKHSSLGFLSPVKYRLKVAAR